jgi:hypothetical protein
MGGVGGEHCDLMAVLSITDLTQRYVNLLASQYQQPNAQQQIALWAKQFLADNFVQTVQAGYQLGGAMGAQGVQLDVLGKYIGVNRYQAPNTNLPPFFGMLPGTFTYNLSKYQGAWNASTDTPTIPAASGGNSGNWYAVQVAGPSTSPISSAFNQGDIIHSNGSVWQRDTTYNANGFNFAATPAENFGAIFITEQSYNAPLVALTDLAYTQLLWIQIVRNVSNGSLPDIIARLKSYFGTGISLVDNLNMTVTYTVVQAQVVLPSTVLTTFLPCPAGVGLTLVLV